MEAEAEKPTANQFMRADQIQGWQGYSFPAKFWIMMVNYGFAVLPGIIIMMRQIYIEDEKVTRNSSLSLSYFTVIMIFLAYIGMSLFQIMYFKRFMSLRLTTTFMLGQIVSLIAVLMTMSGFLMKKIKTKIRVKDSKVLSKISVFLVLLSSSFVPFLLHAMLNPMSELWVKA